MSGAIGRSYRIFRESFAVLLQDKEILLFPLMAAAALVFVFAAAVGGVWLLDGVPTAIADLDAEEPNLRGYAVTFLWYLGSWFVALFFNVAVLECARIRFEGRDPTIADGLRASTSHLGRIATWALIAATVGLIAQVVRERGRFLLRFVSTLAELAWTVGTFFVVPVMIFEGRSVKDSVNRSVDLIRRTWGEALVGSGGIALFATLLTLAGIVALAAGFAASISAGSWTYLAVGFVVATVWFLGVACLSTTLDGIYRAALYLYATEHRVPAAFSEEHLSSAFRQKR